MTKNDHSSTSLLGLANAQAPLAITWVIGVTAICLVFGVQTLNGRFSDQGGSGAAWDWLADWILPGVSVVLGGLVANASGLIDSFGRGVRPLLFWIALWFSVVYLASLLGVIVGASFLDGGPFAAYHAAEIPLGFAQSITLFTLAVFFARREQATSRTPNLANIVAAE